MKRILWVCLLVFGLMLSWTLLYAGDFYVIPVKSKVTSWDKKISGAARFELVLDDQAVLDKETGLVWAKDANWMKTNDPGFDNDGTAGNGEVKWQHAINYCANLSISDRKGWRLPEREELASLLDMSVSGYPKLSAGYPFINVAYHHWSSTTYEGDSTISWLLRISRSKHPSLQKNIDRFFHHISLSITHQVLDQLSPN